MALLDYHGLPVHARRSVRVCAVPAALCMYGTGCQMPHVATHILPRPTHYPTTPLPLHMYVTSTAALPAQPNQADRGKTRSVGNAAGCCVPQLIKLLSFIRYNAGVYDEPLPPVDATCVHLRNALRVLDVCACMHCLPALCTCHTTPRACSASNQCLTVGRLEAHPILYCCTAYAPAPLLADGGMWRWLWTLLLRTTGAAQCATTARSRAVLLAPASIRYGREPGVILLILLTGVAYSAAAPLLTPFALAYFFTSYLVWRYQIIYVCTRAYEGGGRLWPVFSGIVLWCLALFVVFTSAMLIFKGANLQGVLMLALLPLLYLFNRNRTRGGDDEHPPLWLAHAAPRVRVDPDVYNPPWLRPGAAGWHPEVGKAWVRWGVPAFCT